jgi:DNA-binding NarL/FixJ family response regulator
MNDLLQKTRVLLVDDHALFREGIATILAAQPDLQVVGEAEDGLEAIVKAQELMPDLVVMDIQMPGMDGLEAARQIKKDLPETVIVMLTVRDDDEKLFQAIRNGAQGYLLKNIHAHEMVEQLHGALRGEAAIPPRLAGRMLEEFRRLSQASPPDSGDETPDLTPREQEILSLVAQGLSDKQIAAQLSLSLHTVKSHLRNILAKLQVESRREAARLAKKRGLL